MQQCKSSFIELISIVLASAQLLQLFINSLKRLVHTLVKWLYVSKRIYCCPTGRTARLHHVGTVTLLNLTPVVNVCTAVTLV